MIEAEQETELQPQQDSDQVDDTIVPEENLQQAFPANEAPTSSTTDIMSLEEEVNIEEEDCSNRPDPPSIIDGEEENAPRGDIPTAVSTLETNQSLLSEEDFSVSDTQKEEDGDDDDDDEEIIMDEQGKRKNRNGRQPNSPLSHDGNAEQQLIRGTSIPEDSFLAKPNRIARDPSISLADVFSNHRSDDDDNEQHQQQQEESEILQAVEDLYVRRSVHDTPPIWDDHDEDGFVRKGDVGLQHVRERLTPTTTGRIELLPPIEERPRIFIPEPLQKQQSFDQQRLPTSNSRRRIRLNLQEEIDKRWDDSFIGHIRRRSALFRSPVDESQYQSRGHITVSWYDGTSTLELNEHVRGSAMRKLKLASYMELKDLRFIDETVDPPEEVVLSPFIPDGAQFTLQFALRDTRYDGDISPVAPESPSAAPSPKPARLLSNFKEKELSILRMPSVRRQQIGLSRSWDTFHHTPKNVSTPLATTEEDENQSKKSDKSFEDELPPPEDNNNEDPVEMRLRQITELLLSDQRERSQFQGRRNEKRQVVFTLANYFVLFLSLLAISAEIQARAPAWLHNLEMQMKNVTDCASDKEALFRCVSNGEFAGLIASVIIWLTRNVATRRIFLLGFESPQKLWTVVYEALVTACSWGFSYLFVRRALNPDTRPRFLRKYWKDAVYGSLAGFNAFFLKQVLKNLLPQEAVEEMVFEPKLKILSWLPSFSI